MPYQFLRYAEDDSEIVIFYMLIVGVFSVYPNP